MRGNRCIGIPCTVSFAMIPGPHEKSRDDQAKVPLDLWNSDEIIQNTCPLDNECYSHREHAVTLSKNYYITWERWGRCPYPARFVGLAKGKLVVKYDDCGLTCSRLRSG
jgi:hypothetical protein